MKSKIDFKYFSKDLFRSIWIIWRAGKGMATINTALQFFQALLPILSLYYIKLLVEIMASANKSDFNSVLPAIIGFCTIQFLIAVTTQLSNYISSLQQQKIADHVSGMVLDKAVKVRMEYYENPDYHDTLHLAQQQSQFRIPQLVANLNLFLQNSLMLVFLICFFFTLQWFYALLFILLSLPLAAIKWYYSYRLYWLEKKFVPMEREAGYLHEILTGAGYAKEVRSFGFAGQFIQKFRNIRSTIYAGKKKLQIKLNRYSLVAQAVEILVMAGIFLMLAKNAWAGAITIGVFVIYIQGFQRLQAASKNFLQSFIMIYQQRLFLRDFFLFFDIQSPLSQDGAAFPEIKKGLAIEHLSFAYPQTEKTVLSDISITCEPGKITAIIGENGSGKSTLVKLLARLYELPTGSITLDGAAISTISEDAYRANTFFLFQDFEKYFFTIEENIALAGANKKSAAGIQQAALLAGADEFIAKLPDAYQTRLGRIFQKGWQLSGGQWQKLALARMFYKSPPVIILDEPTSSIDALAEFELFNSLKQYAEGKIVLLISHRLYNLKIADRIYVMKDGRIAEEGNFDQLINQNGIFKKMFDNQKL
jgi:ATP-binding cassette, subfamily B, bacterial